MSNTKEPKLYVIMAIIALCLLFSAISIELNLIVLPVFTSNVVTTVTLTAALALTIMIYSIAFIKKQKTLSTQTQTKPAIHTINTPNKTPTIITPPTNNQKTSRDTDKYLENYKTQQKTQPINQPTKHPNNQTPTNKYLENYKTQQKTQPINQPTTQPTTQPNNQTTPQKITQLSTEKNATTNPETIINKDKTLCPNCQKEYSIPLFSLDYSASKPKLISLCPYCNKPLNSQPKNAAEEALWNKYVPKP